MNPGMGRWRELTFSQPPPINPRILSRCSEKWQWRPSSESLPVPVLWPALRLRRSRGNCRANPVRPAGPTGLLTQASPTELCEGWDRRSCCLTSALRPLQALLLPSARPALLAVPLPTSAPALVTLPLWSFLPRAGGGWLSFSPASCWFPFTRPWNTSSTIRLV